MHPSGYTWEDAVNGDMLVWTASSDDRAYVHRLSTNTNTSIWNRPGSASPFQSDISASGDVYYGTYEEPWIRRLGVSRIGNHPGNLQRPITDGTNVAGRWWNGRVSSSYLFTAGGEEVFLGDSISGNSAGLLLHAGYAGFLRSDGAVNQVWVRTAAAGERRRGVAPASADAVSPPARTRWSGVRRRPGLSPAPGALSISLP
ncbi:hypothetical protein WME91_06695 [Sorangium sp. So ce269]